MLAAKVLLPLRIGPLRGEIMRVRNGLAVVALALFGASSAFAGTVDFTFNFGGPNMDLDTPIQNYTSTVATITATITAYGFECSAPTPMSTSVLSNCAASNLYQTPGGLGLANQVDQEIGWEGTNADYVIGMNLSDLFSLGVKSIILSFSNVGPGQAWAALGYPSDPFTPGASIQLGGDTKAWSEIDSWTFNLGPDDEYLILISSCGASSNPNGPCGSYLSPITLTGSTTHLTPTPEPGTIALFATGLLMMLGFATRKRWALQRT